MIVIVHVLTTIASIALVPNRIVLILTVTITKNVIIILIGMATISIIITMNMTTAVILQGLRTRSGMKLKSSGEVPDLISSAQIPHQLVMDPASVQG